MGRHRKARNPLEFILPIPVAIGLVGIAILVSISPTRSAPAADPAPLSLREECQQARLYPDRTIPDILWLEQCEHALEFRSPPATTPPATPPPTTTTPTFTAPPTTTPQPTTAPPTTTTPPNTTPPDPPGNRYCAPWPAIPDTSCTGYVHTGVTLHQCDEGDGDNDGHLTVTRTFDGCLFQGNQGFLRIQAPNIVIKNSKLIGVMATHWSSQHKYMGLKVIDTEITGFVNDNAPIADGDDYSCLRCHVHDTSTGIGGGNNVSIIDSVVDRMVYATGAHQAAVGMNYGSNITIWHNNLSCWRVNVPPGPQGCSAALSLYDEGTMNGVLVKNNLFNAAGEYCAYSGGPTAKNVKFISNLFGTRFHPNCGNSGPLHSWYPSNEGYEWTDNFFTDGRQIIR